MTVGERLKYFRSEKGLTQMELAELSHVSASNIRKIEYDERNPSISVLRKLSEALEVDVSVFLICNKPSEEDIMQIFFMLESAGMKIDEVDNKISLNFDEEFNNGKLQRYLSVWADKSREAVNSFNKSIEILALNRLNLEYDEALKTLLDTLDDYQAWKLRFPMSIKEE